MGFSDLLMHGCLIPQAGTRVVVLDRDGAGPVQVRAYGPAGNALVLWTSPEALTGCDAAGCFK